MSIPVKSLYEKIKEHFKNKYLNKEFVDTIHDLEHFPKFVREFLISKYANEEGTVDADDLKNIISEIKKNSFEKADKEKIKSICLELSNIELIDHVQVYVDLKNGRYVTHIKQIDEKALVNKDLVQPGKYDDLLKCGLWGKATYQYIKNADAIRFNLCDFTPYQSSGVVLSGFKNKRKNFSTSEWIDLLIKSIGINPEVLSEEQKMLYLARLIPLVEARTNSLELGQAGTGKSFVYEQASEFARVFLGQDISEAVLIYNEQNKQLGIIFNKDLICFDEVDKGKSSFRHIIPKLQQIMASNSVERGEFQAMTDISIVFQGNILFRESSGQREPTYSNFIEQHLPKEMQDVSFLDRIHLFIRGWELPTFSTDLKNKDIGLVYNYLGHIFHKFRKENVYDSIRERFQFFKRTSDNREVALSARDNTALRHIISGYVKLIFPDLQISDEELKMILKYAIKLRQNVINEIIKFGYDR
jgi:ATP-dependent Lon protease